MRAVAGGSRTPSDADQHGNRGDGKLSKPRRGRRERKKRKVLYEAINKEIGNPPGKRLTREEIVHAIAAKEIAESKKIARAWRTAKSALHRGYDRPVNRQAAKDLSRPRRRNSKLDPT